MADILAGDPITPTTITPPRGPYFWEALTWDPKRDVIWASHYADENSAIYTIDDDPPYTATFQFYYHPTISGFTGEVDGLGYDHIRDTLWLSAGDDVNVWEVSPIPDGDQPRVLTHFMTAIENSGTAASFQHVWLTDEDSETVRKADKDGTNIMFYALPNPDPEYEKDMEFDYKTIRNGCLLWIIDRGEPVCSSIEAYIIPCDYPVGGEISPTSGLALMAPWIALMLAAITIGYTILRKKTFIR